MATISEREKEKKERKKEKKKKGRKRERKKEREREREQTLCEIFNQSGHIGCAIRNIREKLIDTLMALRNFCG